MRLFLLLFLDGVIIDSKLQFFSGDTKYLV